MLINGTRCGLTPHLRKLLRRRSAIKPEIGHMKSDGRLARCALKGRTGDVLFAHPVRLRPNIRKILTHLRVFLLALFTSLVQALTQTNCGPAVGRTA